MEAVGESWTLVVKPGVRLVVAEECGSMLIADPTSLGEMAYMIKGRIPFLPQVRLDFQGGIHFAVLANVPPGTVHTVPHPILPGKPVTDNKIVENTPEKLSSPAVVDQPEAKLPVTEHNLDNTPGFPVRQQATQKVPIRSKSLHADEDEHDETTEKLRGVLQENPYRYPANSRDPEASAAWTRILKSRDPSCKPTQQDILNLKAVVKRQLTAFSKKFTRDGSGEEPPVITTEKDRVLQDILELVKEQPAADSSRKAKSREDSAYRNEVAQVRMKRGNTIEKLKKVDEERDMMKGRESPDLEAVHVHEVDDRIKRLRQGDVDDLVVLDNSNIAETKPLVRDILSKKEVANRGRQLKAVSPTEPKTTRRVRANDEMISGLTAVVVKLAEDARTDREIERQEREKDRSLMEKLELKKLDSQERQRDLERQDRKEKEAQEREDRKERAAGARGKKIRARELVTNLTTDGHFNSNLILV